jgi:protein-S-isoprenylcysteine O-methyltransferase Ste14
MLPVDEAVRGRREAGLGLYDETRRLRRRERRGEEDSGKDQARADDGQSTAIKTYLAGAECSVWDFATFGRGTPLPIDAPKRLVVRGLYRYTRNPMYVGVLTVISGWALLFQTGALVGYLCLVGIGFHLFVILYEEQHLHAMFGDEYDAYRHRVGRWLPGFGRPPAA